MKYLPIFLLIGGAVLVSLVGFIVFNLRSKEPSTIEEEEVAAVELPFEDRPYIALTPNSAGNELAFSMSKIPVVVGTVEYELVYNTAANVKQGVPGSVDVVGKSTLDRKLTLGTCSSGVCRYDKGVHDIQISLKFKDSKGKTIAKTPAIMVNLLSNMQNLSDSNKKFSLSLDKKTKDYYVVMQTYGAHGKVPGTINLGPFGVFTSGSKSQSGTVGLSGKVYSWSGSSWQELNNGKTKTLGTFISTE